MDLSKQWLDQGLALLTCPPAVPCIEVLQAYGILGHLSMQFEGFTGVSGSLLFFCSQMARKMGLHLIDMPAKREERRRGGANLIEVEVKRRIWWHIVSTDWIMANMGGPQEGTYSLHPHQMKTNPPSNVEDENIPVGHSRLSEDEYSVPLGTTSTTVSYFIVRTKLATLFREVIDNLPAGYFASPSSNVSVDMYETILSLDQRFMTFLKSLPPYFQLHSDIHMDTNNSNSNSNSNPLSWQRYLIHHNFHTQLARLHRPFLIRGSSEPRFAYSRMQCIRSAETVIEIHRAHFAQYPHLPRVHYMQHHLLMATVVLTMDVCFNPDEIKAAARKADLLAIFRILEQEELAFSSAHHPSRAINRAVQVLRKMLDKNNICTLDKQEASSLQLHPVHMQPVLEPIQLPETQQHQQQQQPPSDDFWNEFIHYAPSFDVPDWGILFNNLDSQYSGLA
ncbi:hypothetical protein ASPZODRAFT_73891 [Penicilliopsis zonata CBS 506.65]|uniref:Transcription factor domain-containing protein n=1 Tax=Penicilliopsis zonata CBS 506.65 TaxID=1073090 RepID=A0A1L9S951_9EURO|nr:hypothetical protein ASPZODRAFT_73891 [Penicilliopsis zonata CBS 506.65]OJJ43687.1 hypothetical protein ASPZODRAFT_73891 [Penicilliopsis zonata CBS 506.65]